MGAVWHRLLMLIGWRRGYSVSFRHMRWWQQALWVLYIVAAYYLLMHFVFGVF